MASEPSRRPAQRTATSTPATPRTANQDDADIGDADPAESVPGENSGAGVPNPPGAGMASPVAEEDDAEDPRRVAHEVLGQAHATLVIAGKEDVLPLWCPQELRDDFRRTEPEVYAAIGRAHADVSTGRHDEGLRSRGIGGPPGRLKRRLLRRALERLGAAFGAAGDAISGDRARRVTAWLRAAVAAAKIPIDSLAQEIPGGHVIKEALDGVLAGLDSTDALAESSPGPNRPPAGAA